MFRYIIRNEHITGKWITADKHQSAVIELYVQQYRERFGHEPVGLHYFPELKDFVLLSPTEALLEGE